MVELCAMVARIFSEYSVELAIEETGKSREGEDTCGEISWEQARKMAEHQMSAGLEFKMSLRSVGDSAAVFCQEGGEKVERM